MLANYNKFIYCYSATAAVNLDTSLANAQKAAAVVAAAVAVVVMI